MGDEQQMEQNGGVQGGGVRDASFGAGDESDVYGEQSEEVYAPSPVELPVVEPPGGVDTSNLPVSEDSEPDELTQISDDDVLPSDEDDDYLFGTDHPLLDSSGPDILGEEPVDGEDEEDLDEDELDDYLFGVEDPLLDIYPEKNKVVKYSVGPRTIQSRPVTRPETGTFNE